MARHGDSPLRESPPTSDRDSSFDREDFLYHLYRGNELLRDNCVSEAKEELERALHLQPRDAHGQSLLGFVYFRLGLYPRAIEIFEDLLSGHPTDLTIRVNLGLCYLKTGQYDRAKLILEEVVMQSPHHVKAWGYLGLVFERQGDFHKAREAFHRADQPQWVGRMEERLRGLDEERLSLRPPPLPDEWTAPTDSPQRFLTLSPELGPSIEPPPNHHPSTPPPVVVRRSERPSDDATAHRAPPSLPPLPVEPTPGTAASLSPYALDQVDATGRGWWVKPGNLAFSRGYADDEREGTWGVGGLRLAASAPERQLLLRPSFPGRRLHCLRIQRGAAWCLRKGLLVAHGEGLRCDPYELPGITSDLWLVTGEGELFYELPSGLHFDEEVRPGRQLLVGREELCAWEAALELVPAGSAHWWGDAFRVEGAGHVVLWLDDGSR